MDILDTRQNLNAMVLKHEQQIKDLAAHLLELKQLVTPMMEFKQEKSKNEPVAWLVTYGGLTHVAYTPPAQVVDTHYQPLYIALHRPWVGLRKATPDNMSEAVIKARERHGKPFSYEPGSTWKPHDTPVLTSWLQSKGEKK